jgi:hypothetical protein
MINNFKKKFGNPEDTIFIIGDYDKGDYHRKGKEPTILKKFRNIFKNAKYNTYLINENGVKYSKKIFSLSIYIFILFKI